MNDALTVTGILLGALGVALLALIYLYPESSRREKRRIRNLTERARDAGLRGRWKFEVDRSKSGTISRYGTYEPEGDEDRVLYAAVGSRIEGEAEFFASELLLTDARLTWVGAGLLLIGIAVSVDSLFL